MWGRVDWVAPLFVALMAASGMAEEDKGARWAEELRGRIVDLTHVFDERTIYWPTEGDFRLERGPAGTTEKGYFYAANRFAAAEHGGTHIDAPIHFFEGRQTVDQIPLDRLIGPGVRVDVRAACEADRNHEVSIDDLRQAEGRSRQTLHGKIVLLHTGFGRFWSDREKYLGTAERGPKAVSRLRFPGLHPEAARWLVLERGIKAVGIDTASIDHGPSTTFQSHVILCQHNVPALENVANLDQLPAQFVVIALPMKIGGGSGSPVRIVAVTASGA